jgi:DNA mismatch repair protein MutS2
MAQAGLFIPVSDGSTVPVFRNIYADIGDEQSIEQSLSTFSSHMKNIVEITSDAKDGSLVLLDELGAGTDPTEGAALAIAILDRLFGQGAKTIATTHYTELKKYAISTPGVQNASMEFDVETLSPTYRLTIGIPGKSNAFEISSKLGLDPVIIDRARGLLEQGDIAFEDVISSIEADKKQAQADRAAAAEALAAAEAQREKTEAAEAKLRARREEILEDARVEARIMIDEAEETIKEIQRSVAEFEAQASEDAKRELNRQIEQRRRALRERRKEYASKSSAPSNPDPPKAGEIHEGDRVNVLSVDQKAVVISPPDDHGNLVVQLGQIKLNVNISGVTLVQENVTEKQREKIKYSRLAGQKARSVPLSINVVGKTLADAEIEVEKYLDDAFLSGTPTVTIIHGRGAGILRDGIARLLKANRNVAGYRKGEYKEGGDGVTIVTFKR